MKMTRRFKVVAGVVATLALLLTVSASSVFADDLPQPPFGFGACGGAGTGMMGSGGMMGLGGMMGSGGMMGPGGMMGAATDDVAKLLGMSQADLVNAWQSGKTLKQIAQEKGVGEDALLQAMLAPHRARMALMVQSGVLTQEQADLMLQTMEAMASVAMGQQGTQTGAGVGGFGGMMGGFGGYMGSMMQRFGFGPGQQPNQGQGNTVPGPQAGRGGMMRGWR